MGKVVTENVAMPLIMCFTNPSSIIEEKEEQIKVNYDDCNQIYHNMALIGTRCLKTSSTKIKNCVVTVDAFGNDYPRADAVKTDSKNEIDDSKNK